MRRLTILILFTAACGSDSGNKVDAPSHIDAPMQTLDCASYCTAIIANCTAANLVGQTIRLSIRGFHE